MNQVVMVVQLQLPLIDKNVSDDLLRQCVSANVKGQRQVILFLSPPASIALCIRQSLLNWPFLSSATPALRRLRAGKVKKMAKSRAFTLPQHLNRQC